MLSTLKMLCLILRITWEVGTVVREEETGLEKGSGTCPALKAGRGRGWLQKVQPLHTEPQRWNPKDRSKPTRQV